MFDISASTATPWHWPETSAVESWLVEVVQGTRRDVQNMAKASETGEAKGSSAAPQKRSI